MIGFLKGKIIVRDGPFLIVDTGGVGYRVLVPASILPEVSKKGEVELFTYTHVREDSLELFGFLNLMELKLFENLISISGIGPRTAVSIFSFGPREEIARAIVAGDVEFFTRVPRLGRKNAQKIIIELKNKLGGGEDIDLAGERESQDVVEALKTFGFSTTEIREALKKVTPGAGVDERIKQALKYLGK